MQPDISPLAKRLAEENNVEWQGLYGSGSDGRIVERDVLEYLARVMAGEEDLNPTPEPLPAGMEAWPEEAAQSAASRNAQPPVRLAANGDSTGEPGTTGSFGAAPTVPNAPRVEINRATGTGGLEDDDDTADISDDIFLFDDLEDEPTGHADAPQAVDPEAAPGLFRTDAAALEASFALDSDDLPADLDVSFSADMAATTADKPDSATPDFSFDADFAVGPAAQTVEFGASNDMNTQDDAAEDDLEMLDVTFGETPKQADTEDVALFTESAAPGDGDESEASLFLTGVEDDTLEDDALALGEPTNKDDEDEQAFSVPPVPAAEAGNVGRSAPAEPQLVSYGLLLRRHVDLTSFRQAQVAVGQELGQAGPISPSSLLLRAAAKALAAAPLNGHETVGLAVFGDRAVKVAAVPDVLTQPFKKVVAAAAQPDTETGQSASLGVVVADMSELDVDEAVLNAGAPVLTLGRVLQDGGAGTNHSTLSLSGETTVEQGTRFLAAVAALLDSPIRLVV